MPRRTTTLSRRLTVVEALVVALVVTACGGTQNPSPTNPPGGPTSSGAAVTASADPAFASILADALARSGQAVPEPEFDPDRAGLLDEAGVPTALGTDADQILATLAGSETAARAKIVLPTDYGRTSRATEPGDSEPNAVLASFHSFPAPYHEFRDFMRGGVVTVGLAGPTTNHEDLGTETATQTEGAFSGTSQIHSILDVAYNGSDVKLEFDTDIQNTVTDTATGSTVMTETRRFSMTGEIDACPSSAGLVPASLVVTSNDETSTFAGAGGRVGTHSTASLTRSSKFQGTADDQATLGAVSQTYTHDEKFKRTASADGGPEQSQEGNLSLGIEGINNGVPAESNSFLPTIGDWSTSTTTGTSSGANIDKMMARVPGGAAADYATMQASYVEAQKVWRDSRCVIVTAPDYIPESAFANNAKPTHTEEVQKGSSTQFQVGLGHRFKQTVAAKITAQLDGKESLSPDTIPSPPGSLTYVAPDQDGQDGIVKLESVSKQGIGRLTLTFHTGSKKLKVTIDGTMTTSGFGVKYTTTVHAKDILLSRTIGAAKPSPDGITYTLSYAGSGPATAEILLDIADCRKPYTQKGTLSLIAEHEFNEDHNLDLRWIVSWDPNSTLTTTGGSCVGLPLDSFTGSAGAGPVGGLMTVLDKVQFDPKGGEQRVRKTVTLGPSKNVIDVTVTAEIVSESAP
jgi:hypothetical protein